MWCQACIDKLPSRHKKHTHKAGCLYLSAAALRERQERESARREQLVREGEHPYYDTREERNQ